MTRSEMRRVIWVLDDLVDQTKLPFASDIEAWNVLLGPLLPSDTQASWSTILKTLNGTHRSDVIRGMDTQPTKLLEYLQAPGDDGHSDRGNDGEGFDARPRPMSEAYRNLRQRVSLMPPWSVHSAEGQLALAVQAAQDAEKRIRTDLDLWESG